MISTQEKDTVTFVKELNTLFTQASRIAISGHIRPDGDCVGSCMGLYHYINNNYNLDNNKQIDVYLEEVPETFLYLLDSDKIQTEAKETSYDLFVSLDCGSIDRLGPFDATFQQAKTTVNIDHHISNTLFARYNHVEADASSTCEVLSAMFEESQIDLASATALYTGIIHDTGVFKHANTKRRTMELAGMLLSKGVDNTKIILESFFEKTYVQNQILGRCLLESMLVLQEKVIISTVNRKQMEFYSATNSDLDGIIDKLRETKGVEVAVLIHETDLGEYKVSMRSNGDVDVSKIATYFGGGGHIRAAGCSMKGSIYDVINNLNLHIENQMKSLGLLK